MCLCSLLRSTALANIDHGTGETGSAQLPRVLPLTTDWEPAVGLEKR